jgi:hypothetical protein
MNCKKGKNYDMSKSSLFFLHTIIPTNCNMPIAVPSLSGGNIEFLVSNRDRDPGDDALNFSVQLPYTNEFEQASYAMAVDCVTMENIFPIVATGVNDQLWFRFNDGAVSNFIFEEGNYDIFDLLDTLKAFLLTIHPGFDLVYDANQYKLILVVPPSNTFTLLRTHNKPLDNLTYRLPDRTDRTLELLGWSFGQLSSMTLSGTWIPDNIVRIRTTAYLHLNTNLHIGQIYTSDPTSSDHTLIRFPIDYPYGTVAHYQKVQPIAVKLSEISGLVLRFNVTDEWGVQRLAGAGKNILLAFQLSLKSLDAS